MRVGEGSRERTGKGERETVSRSTGRATRMLGAGEVGDGVEGRMDVNRWPGNVDGDREKAGAVHGCGTKADMVAGVSGTGTEGGGWGG